MTNPFSEMGGAFVEAFGGGVTYDVTTQTGVASVQAIARLFDEPVYSDGDSAGAVAEMGTFAVTQAVAARLSDGNSVSITTAAHGTHIYVLRAPVRDGRTMVEFKLEQDN